MDMREIVLIAHDLRSSHNVGSLLRTAEGLGVKKVYLTGYTPYPQHKQDKRLPHIAQKVHKQISKTALDAETLQEWEHLDSIGTLIKKLKNDGYQIAALEQTGSALPLNEFEAPNKIAILLGREVEGVEPEILDICDFHLEIPMFGNKESFNVVQAAAMALYKCRFEQ